MFPTSPEGSTQHSLSTPARGAHACWQRSPFSCATVRDLLIKRERGKKIHKDAGKCEHITAAGVTARGPHRSHSRKAARFVAVVRSEDFGEAAQTPGAVQGREALCRRCPSAAWPLVSRSGTSDASRKCRSVSRTHTIQQWRQPILKGAH